MPMKQLLYALVISTFVGGIFTLGQSVIFGGGAVYLYDDDYAKVDEMNYADAREYLATRTQEISGYESFMNGASYWRFWRQFLKIWLYYTFMGLLCCILFVIANNHFRTNSGKHLEGKVP